MGQALPLLSENSVGTGTREVNQQQREARSRSWLESRGLFWHRSQGSAQPAGACRAGRAGTQDREGAGSLAGREGPSGGGFSVTVASALSG